MSRKEQPEKIRPEYSLFLDYLNVECGLAQNTILAYRRDFAKFDTFIGPDFSLDKVDADRVSAFILHLAKNGCSPATQSRALACLKSFYRFLTVERVVNENPTALIESARQWKKLPAVLTPEQTAALISAPDTKTVIGTRDRAILELLYASGLRASELTGLKTGDVNLGDGFLRAFGKGAKERVVPVGDMAKTSLAAYLEKNRPKLDKGRTDRLFLSRNGRKLDRHALYRLVTKYARAAGLKGKIGVHTLRAGNARACFHRYYPDIYPRRSLADSCGAQEISPQKLRIGDWGLGIGERRRCNQGNYLNQ